jgi:penicillin-binding protein 2
MWSVVNGSGTASNIRREDFAIAGKTGTAQVVELGKDVGRNKDHSWFVSYAPAFQPELAVLALIENSGFGSHHAAPAARAIYDVYFEKVKQRRFEPSPELQVASETESRPAG